MATHGLSVLGVLAFAVPLSCSPTDELAAEGAAGGAGSGGTGAGGDAGAPNDPAIWWNDAGVITSDANDFGIQGTWFFETDCDGAAAAGLPCTAPDATMVGPDGQPGWTTSAHRVCTKGVATQVTTDPMTGMPAYELQWGAQIGFELNGTTSGARGTYDAVMHGLRGLRADITTTTGAPPTVRVNFVSTSTKGNGMYFVEVMLPAIKQALLLEDNLQVPWLVDPVVLDKTALTVVTFQVYTTSAPKPFEFCVSNMSVVQ